MHLQTNIMEQEERDLMIKAAISGYLHECKADLNGCCIKLLSDDAEFKEMWQDNFKPFSNYIRPHGRIFAVTSKEYGTNDLFYEPISKTCFLYNCDYYGHVKSIALAIAGDFLEEYRSIHSRYSVHGAAIDVRGRGMALIAPSGTGKTTLSYGLLLDPRSRLVSDDWFYAQVLGDIVLCSASEENVYIRASMQETYPEFAETIEMMKMDSTQRGIVDISGILGNAKKATSTVMEKTVFLERDPQDEPFYKMDAKEAMDYIVEQDFCNPHLLVTTGYKTKIRKDFFKEFFERTDVYMLNTVETPQQSLDRLKKLMP